MPTTPSTPTRDIYTVSRLNHEVIRLLTGHFPLIWVEGEISNLSRPRSGHIYFSLKDEHAQVRAAMFRNRNLYLGFRPDDGMQVLVRARVGLYEPRGDFQLIVEHMEQAGDGALRRAFERLKHKLDAEGLFDAARKQTLPAFPRRIGVITSGSGAALRDVLHVLERRYPLAGVRVYPVAVQGARAPQEIVEAVERASERGDCDVLLLVRGGGSLEDLAAFNDERVARAVAACTTPVVAGVGHEIDFTIADFVADVRAPTPSAAAELATPDITELKQRLAALTLDLDARIRGALVERAEQLRNLRRRLQLLHPARRLDQQRQSLDEYERRLSAAVRHRLQAHARRLSVLEQALARHSPSVRLTRAAAARAHLQQRLHQSMQRQLSDRRHRLALASRHLNAVSPLATLQRGYAIVSDHDTGRALRDSREATAGQRLNIRLARGTLAAVVDQKGSTADDRKTSPHAKPRSR